ncbi:MAG: NADPH-dependent glutamate synthase [Oscillospiraceae bacterium]|jgi:glutamate synthase (NADPH/NADH) small chain|nr:NADPH-dependent glutamate synthase [Oscillospiraceae bacterium]
MTNRNIPPLLEQTLRRTTFGEVNLGFDEETATAEAARCLNCNAPKCVGGCPVNVPIPEFISELKQGNARGAYQKIISANALPSICGRVCPQERQCEGQCILGIKGEPVAIGQLERYAADNGNSNAPISKSVGDKTAAVIGTGPASLAFAGELLAHGVPVTMYEANHTAGGVLVYGIPEFRLPKRIVRDEIARLVSLGAEIKLNAVVGNTHTLAELREKHTCVFIGTGAGLPQFLNIKGEGLPGVFSANEYLTRANLCKAYLPEYDTPLFRADTVAVIGGGNVAMDAARTALRIGAKKVVLLYRRTVAEMPARTEEVRHAVEEGIVIKELSAPLEFTADERGRLNGIVYAPTKLTEPDERGRRNAIIIEGATQTLPVECAVIAVGTSPNPIIANNTPELHTERGRIITDENGATNLPNVYSGGDAVTGAATVISAMGAGKRAAVAALNTITR